MIEVTCPKCGKTHIPAPQHIYRDRFGYYCSWTCYNHRRDHVKKTRSRQVEQCTKSGERITVYKSSKEAADAVFCSDSAIRQACKGALIFHGYVWRYV